MNDIKLQYEQIDLDIPRTFSISNKESRVERDNKLRRILRVISTSIKSGYVQGQNFIIGERKYIFLKNPGTYIKLSTNNVILLSPSPHLFSLNMHL